MEQRHLHECEAGSDLARASAGGRENMSARKGREMAPLTQKRHAWLHTCMHIHVRARSLYVENRN